MKSICYVIPYFGTLPKDGFKLWLLSCKYNPTVNFLLVTDDKTEYDYPDNVKVIYTSFEEIKEKIQKLFDFKISLERPYKLCDFRPMYGQIFSNELKDFDFWGYCDVDLMFGDIRKFYTDEILSSYERVGRYGHSMLYHNTERNNNLYKTNLDGKLNYVEACSTDTSYAFDEVHMDDRFNYLGIPFYDDIVFANLTKYETKLHLQCLDESDEYKNDKQVLTWENGKVYRYYLYNGKINKDEFMYIHFWCRPITFKVSNYNADKYLIYPDVLTDKDFEISESLIKKLGRSKPISFYAKALWRSRKKLTPERIIFNIKGSLNSKRN